VELKPNMSFDLHCAIDSFREMQGANIETIVDSFLQDFRRCDPFVQSEGAGNVPTFALWVGPLKVEVQVGYTRRHWNALLRLKRLQWLSDPYRWEMLDDAALTHIRKIASQVRADVSIPDGDRLNALWDRLSCTAREVIDAEISEEEWNTCGRKRIREELIDTLTRDARCATNDFDLDFRVDPQTEVVLLERISRRVCARGADVSEAASNLGVSIGAALKPERASRNAAGDHDYLAYWVPEFIVFAAEDAGLVERWGNFAGSFTCAPVEADR
jgi:hypothetical protein